MAKNDKELTGLEFLTRRLAIPADDLSNVKSNYFDWAFSITGITKADYIQYMKRQVTKAYEEGQDYDTFVSDLRSKEKGMQITEGFRGKHLYTVFDTNIRRAYAAGRRSQLDQDHVKSIYVGRRWEWRDSPQPRKHHQAIDGKIFPSDSVFWNIAFPPCGYGCRCTATGVSQAMLRESGEKIVSPPNPKTIAEKPFTSSAGLSEAEQREEYIKEGISRQSPELQKYIKEELNL